jgi:cytochrome c556
VAVAAIIQGKVEYRDQHAEHTRAVQVICRNAQSPPQKRIGFRRYQGDAAWLKPDEFEKRACGARASADALVKTVAAGDDNVIAARFKELVDACKACHKEFRKEERGIRRGTRLRRFGAGCKLVSLTSRIVASAVVPVFDVKRGE